MTNKQIDNRIAMHEQRIKEIYGQEFTDLKKLERIVSVYRARIVTLTKMKDEVTL